MIGMGEYTYGSMLVDIKYHFMRLILPSSTYASLVPFFCLSREGRGDEEARERERERKNGDQGIERERERYRYRYIIERNI